MPDLTPGDLADLDQTYADARVEMLAMVLRLRTVVGAHGTAVASAMQCAAISRQPAHMLAALASTALTELARRETP
jgi:hypothetical protein